MLKQLPKSRRPRYLFRNEGPGSIPCFLRVVSETHVNVSIDRWCNALIYSNLPTKPQRQESPSTRSIRALFLIPNTLVKKNMFRCIATKASALNAHLLPQSSSLPAICVLILLSSPMLPTPSAAVPACHSGDGSCWCRVSHMNKLVSALIVDTAMIAR